MMNNIVLAIEGMSVGIRRMAQRAEQHGYVFRMLAEDPSMYTDVGAAEIIAFPTRKPEAIKQYVQDHRDELQTVFSPTDTWGVFAAELREIFGFRCRYSAQQLQKIRDKGWLREQFTDGTSTMSEYPRILKPRTGTGSIGIEFIPDKVAHTEFLASVDAPDAYVDEPYYRGPLYSAEMWSNGKEVVFFGVTNRVLTPPPLFLERVKTFPHEHSTPWEREVERWARGLLTHISYNMGFAHIEFIETTTGFAIVELNARIPGALITPAIDACTNYDPYALVVDDALGVVPKLPVAREIHCGHSHVSLFAQTVGTVVGIAGVAELVEYPGNPGWVPSKSIGDTIVDVSSYRARLGNVYATAETPALAQDRAIAASQAIRILVE